MRKLCPPIGSSTMEHRLAIPAEAFRRHDRKMKQARWLDRRRRDKDYVHFSRWEPGALSSARQAATELAITKNCRPLRQHPTPVNRSVDLSRNRAVGMPALIEAYGSGNGLGSNQNGNG